MAEGQYVAVSIVAEQSRGQDRRGEEQEEQEMPEHAGRMCVLDGEFNTGAGNLERGRFRLSGPQRLVLGPRGDEHDVVWQKRLADLQAALQP